MAIALRKPGFTQQAQQQNLSDEPLKPFLSANRDVPGVWSKTLTRFCGRLLPRPQKRRCYGVVLDALQLAVRGVQLSAKTHCLLGSPENGSGAPSGQAEITKLVDRALSESLIVP